MTAQATPYVEQALSHSAELFRRELQSGLPMGSAGGVVPATPAASSNLTAGLAGCSDLKVNAPASGMSVLVNAGQIVVPGSLGSGSGYGIGTGYGFPVVTLNGTVAPTVASNARATVVQLTTQGAYYCYNDNATGQVSLAIAAASGVNPRIDVVGAQVEDAAYSGAANDWKLVVVTGTAAASPTVPAFPANFVPLAYVWVPTASTSVTAGNILDLRISFNRNPFKVILAETANTSIPNNVVTLFKFDTIISDLIGSYASGTGLFTCPVTGTYFVDTCAGWAGSTFASGNLTTVLIYKNGSEWRRGSVAFGNAVLSGVSNLSTLIQLNQGDTLSFQVFQSSGAALNTAGSPGNENYGDIYLVST